MINVDIESDSVSPVGARITTFVLTYPRFIHAEFMTHRMFSRNASSSRAIPVSRQIQMVLDNPAIPIAFTKNKKGMQGGEALSGADHDAAVKAWLEARDMAVKQARVLADLEVHKQYANRILEPFQHITVVCTATDFDNFFALRCHPAAQPEICELATKMYVLYFESSPTLVNFGSWHTPFVGSLEPLDDEYSIKCSVARCARTSYLNHEGEKPSLKDDLQLYNRLIGQIPIHASPAEHQAMAVHDPEMRSGNFRGWLQYRKTLKHENITNFNGPPNL